MGKFGVRRVKSLALALGLGSGTELDSESEGQRPKTKVQRPIEPKINFSEATLNLTECVQAECVDNVSDPHLESRH